MDKPAEKPTIRWGVFVPLAVFFLVAIITGIVEPERFYRIEERFVAFVTRSFGWLFQLSSPVLLGSSIFFGVFAPPASYSICIYGHSG